MIIRPADDKSKDIETLKALAARPDAGADTGKKIEQEIRKIQSGIKGEAEAAYEIEFYYSASKNWMALHDLRLEFEGRVAQIDHLLISRFLEICVCESKRFGLTVAVDCGRLRLVNEIGLDRFQQRRSIAFDREQVVAALVGDLTGDVPLGSNTSDWLLPSHSFRSPKRRA